MKTNILFDKTVLWSAKKQDYFNLFLDFSCNSKYFSLCLLKKK